MATGSKRGLSRDLARVNAASLRERLMVIADDAELVRRVFAARHHPERVRSILDAAIKSALDTPARLGCDSSRR